MTHPRANPPSELYRHREIIHRTAQSERPRFTSNLKPLRPIFYLIILALAIYFVFFSPLFRITKVETEGVKSLEISDYLNQAMLGKNILFFLPGSYLEDLSNKFPILEEAQIIRGLPSTIKVVAKERSQVLIWCADSCYNIDSKGFAYLQIERPADKAYINDTSGLKILQGQQVASPDFINFFLKAVDAMNQMDLKISEALIEQTSFKISFKSGSGFLVILDSFGSLDNQMSALKQVLEKNRSDIREYVDLRVEGLAYIK